MAKVNKIDKNMKFLIAGLGSIGQRHLKNLTALGIHDIHLYRSGKGTLINDSLADYHTHQSLDNALAEKPDAVIVANPTSMHMEVALAAAEQGCHLFLEKPISHSMKGIQSLSRFVRENNLTVMTGFQFRFHPTLLHIKKWLNANVIGRIVTANAHWGEHLPGWHPWEDYKKCYSARKDLGGGVILTLCHPFDYLHWLLGSIKSVFALKQESPILNIDAEETAQIAIEHSDGALSSVHLNYIQKPAQHSLTIVGEKGLIQWDNRTGNASLFLTEEHTNETVSPPAGFERNQMFLNEMIHFIDCVENNKLPFCDLDDGIEALRIALAAIQSIKRKKLIELNGKI